MSVASRSRRGPLTRPRPTLVQLFVVGLAGLCLLLVVLFYLVLSASRESLLETSEGLRDAAARRVATFMERYLDQAEEPLAEVEAEIAGGVLQPDDPTEVERKLYASVLGNPHLAELTLTHTKPSWQVSVVNEGEHISTAHTLWRHGRWTRLVRRRRIADRRADTPAVAAADAAAADPTRHATFYVPARAFYGQRIWSDLHYSEADAGRPAGEQRVVVTVMKTLEDRAGRFVGVLRVGLRRDQIDEVGRFRVDEEDPRDPHRIFLCDATGRLVTRLAPADTLREMGDDLRVEPAQMPAELAAALAHPALSRVTPGESRTTGTFSIAGLKYLVTYHDLPRTQGWRVGVLVPEAHYTAALTRVRARLLAASAGLMLLIVVGGTLTLRVVRSGLGRVVTAAGRMRDFDFAPAPFRSSFRDVEEVTRSLELAKTAMRAMGRYVPIDLVRLLYRTGREPVLGGELAEISLMFTDIRDFTAIAERLSPDELARRLGQYLECMATAIDATHGTIDKYIGDAVMALWNAPTPLPGHARLACQAALECRRSTRALFASPAWAGAPPFDTRFGLHVDTVMVGHFGAPARMSYTALGDGVNLASRLEGLNKHYGTTLLVSEAVKAQTAEAFEFRLLDVVAVKGRAAGLRVYELLGTTGEPEVSRAVIDRYENAFAAYQRRRFEEAASLLRPQVEDMPSRVLLERCRVALQHPPPTNWDGVHVFMTK